MNILRKLSFALLIALPFIVAGGDKIDAGTVDNGVFKSDYFNFSMPLPKEWTVISPEQNKMLMDKGKKVIAGDDKSMQAALDDSVQTTINMITLFKHPLGSPVAFNPSIGIVAEKVSQLPGIKRGKDYLFHVTKLLQASKLNYDISDEIKTVKLGKMDFDVQEMKLSVRNLDIKQKYYSAIVKGYALGIVVSSTTPEDEKLIDEILSKISFEVK